MMVNFRGCRYDEAGPAPGEGLVYLMENLFARDGKLWSRPGLQIEGAASLTATAKTQAIGSLWDSVTTGRVVYFVVRGGEIWACPNTPTTTWSKYVSTANLTSASITLESDEIVHWVQYRDSIIFNDGVNQPFAWDGGTGVGSLTKLTSAPTVCFGRPTVYYGKLFFIKGYIFGGTTYPTFTILWSEENQMNVGYETSPYNNSWDLTQTSSAPLGAIFGTNEGLYYFRSAGIGIITGPVTTDFSTTGTHDAISRLDGSESGSAIIQVGDKVFFLDRTRPKCLWNGKVIPLWQQMSQIYSWSANQWYSDRTVTGNYIGYNWPGAITTVGHGAVGYDDESGMVAFFPPSTGVGGDNLSKYGDAAVFDPNTLLFQGFWTNRTGVDVTAIGQLDYGLNAGTDLKTSIGFGFFNAAGMGRLWNYNRWAVDDFDGDELMNRRVIGPRENWSSRKASEAEKLAVIHQVPVTSTSSNLQVSAMIRSPEHYRDGQNPTEQTLALKYGTEVKNIFPERLFLFDVPANRGRFYQVDLVLKNVTNAGTPITTAIQQPFGLVGWGTDLHDVEDVVGEDY